MSQVLLESFVAAVGLALAATGELILYVVTAGRRRPRLSDYFPGHEVSRSSNVTAAPVVGLLFWVAVATIALEVRRRSAG